MHKESNQSASVTLRQQDITHFFNALLMVICMLFAAQSYANTNAKGVEIEFVTEDSINEEIANIAQPIGEEAILSLAPELEVAPFENNLWLRIQHGYAMPDITSPYTNKYENWYASRPDYIARMMERSQKYLYYVVEEVEKRGMPTEIALLPMIESAYNPQAYSRSHAAGIWQFVPATGKHFGLQQNWWVDNRRNVTAATQAALDYLQKLHDMFGSWDLALAAYNAGEGTVGRAIAKNQKSGLPTDYQNLSLPQETAHYVPKLQAIKNIVTNPEQYGLQLALIPNEAYFAEIDPPFQIDAKLAAKLADISHEEFALLNPSYNRPIIATRNNSHKLLLPVSAIQTFENNLNNYDQSLVSWKVYNAKRGEQLASIAKKFDISINRLREVNDLSSDKKLSKTLHLLVPADDETSANDINVAKLADQKIRSQQNSVNLVTHKIKRGETLSSLAKMYGTNTKDLMKMNRLKSTKLKIGQIIRVKGSRTREKTKRI
jgi:membrane-bound lytic murein transglycosylase D